MSCGERWAQTRDVWITESDVSLYTTHVDRDQYVQLESIRSQLHGISREIHPGSVMDPRLYNIVNNDLIAASEN